MRTTEEIHQQGFKTLDDDIQNLDIVVERYPGELKEWNEKKMK